jgi:spore germination protein GerM
MKKKLFLLILISLITLSFSASGCREKAVKESKIEPQKVKTQEETATSQKEMEKEMEITIYFGDKEAQFLVPEIRSVPAAQTVAKSALEELIKGPESKDKISLIPEGTKVLSISIQNGVAEVNLSKEFKEKYPLGSASENILIYSIVNTLTEFPSIKKVHFLVEGKPLEVTGSNYDLANTYFERNESMIKKD